MASGRRILLVIAASGLLARALIALRIADFPVPDEIYQYFGQAHRLVFGHSVVPWEFEVGLRCWVIPLLLAGPMEAARLAGLAPWAGIAFAKLLTAASSMVVVAAATGWGWRLHGMQGAVICGLAASFWPDLLVMAPHPEEDTLGAYALVGALYLIEPWPSLPRGRELRRAALAGGLLGLAFVLRNPLAPGIAIAGIALCRRDGGKWAAGLGAGAAIVLLAGLLDWMCWGIPFRSFAMNYTLNVSEGVASFFGRAGNGYYPGMLLIDWLWALPFVALAIGFGAGQLPVTSSAAFAILLPYLVMPHKEFRFLFPVIALLVPVAGIGLARLSRVMSRPAWLVLAAAIASGLALSINTRFMLLYVAAGARAEMALAARQPARVGVARTAVPGDLYFGSGTRLVAVADQGDLAGVDGLIMRPGRLRPPTRFRLLGCFRASDPVLDFVQRRFWRPFVNPPVCAWHAAGFDPAVSLPPLDSLLPFPPQARRYVLPGWRGDIP